MKTSTLPLPPLASCIIALLLLSACEERASIHHAEAAENPAAESTASEVVEFEGFIHYGTPIEMKAVDALGTPVTVTLTD